MKLDHKKFFDGYRAKFSALSKLRVAGLDALLTGIENDPAITDVRWAAYMLATVKHECADRWQPIEEFGKGRGKEYGKKHKQTGFAYYGRGYVQLTWGGNYVAVGREIGADLYNHPELALDPAIAYKVMSFGMRNGTFTSKKLSDYLNRKTCDYHNARKIINGLDKAALIAGYATAFEKILRDSLIASPPPTSPDKTADQGKGPADGNPPVGANQENEAGRIPLPQPDIKLEANATGVTFEQSGEKFEPETKEEKEPEKTNFLNKLFGGLTLSSIAAGVIWFVTQVTGIQFTPESIDLLKFIIPLILQYVFIGLCLWFVIVTGKRLFIWWTKVKVNTDPTKHNLETVKPDDSWYKFW